MSRFQDWIFRQVHGKKLIYNTCWEDPRCDRKLLRLKDDSKVVMITSAGDNALDYLLDDPAEIHTVDMNFRQNALLELKRVVFRQTNHETLFNFFGNGAYAEAELTFYLKLRPNLPSYAQEYWDENIDYFSGKGLRKSFYYRGASGVLAFLCRRYIYMRKLLSQNVEYLFSAKTLKEQNSHYFNLEQIVFNSFINKLLNNHYTMCLAGVPKAQQELIQQSFPGGNVEYIQQCFRHVFTELDISDNYFYQVYLRGYYTPDSCPEYLKPNNFNTLQKRQDRIRSYTTTLSSFLKENPGQYTHFVLLDHQDWLAAHDVPALEEEWHLILENSVPGTRVLLRSAATNIDFFPGFVLDKIDFDQDVVHHVHKEDRVGTYASVYLGIVK
jgi:S-adenosylmethionine-diacylglycerol 3-amino-3-carboxypropyl transferase